MVAMITAGSPDVAKYTRKIAMILNDPPNTMILKSPILRLNSVLELFDRAILMMYQNPVTEVLIAAPCMNGSSFALNLMKVSVPAAMIINGIKNFNPKYFVVFVILLEIMIAPPTILTTPIMPPHDKCSFKKK